MSLWKKVRELDSPCLGEVISMYASQNIPIEVRDYFSIWIESSIKHLSPARYAAGLSVQIGEKLGSMSQEGHMGAPDTPFYVIQKLTDFQVTLTSAQPDLVQNIHKRFLQCLEMERIIVSKQRLGSSSPSSLVIGIAASTMATQHEAIEPNCFASNYGHHSPTPTTDDYQQYDSYKDSGITEAFSSKDPNDFLNNCQRIQIDGEMTQIFDAVWGLEESSNMFSIKCHELRRHQEFLDQHARITATNGVRRSLQEFQETQATFAETRLEILGIAADIYGKICDIRNRSENILLNWTQLKSELDINLSQWTHQQKGVANGRPMTMTLDKCQHISEYLMEAACKLRQFLITTDRIRQTNINIFNEDNQNGGGSSHHLPEQLAKVTSFIKALVQDTFVVVHQPTQVLKTNTRIHVAPEKNPMEVRLLVGSKLSLQLSPPTVTISIIDENVSRKIEMNGLEGNYFKTVPNKGRFMPDMKQVELLPNIGSFSAIFRQVSLKDIYRNGRKLNFGREQGGEFVTEEKLCILFRMEFSSGDMKFQAWRTSLPIVVITHGSQESLAWAVITWDNAFSSISRIPFEVPEYVNSDEILEMLNYKFASMVGSPLREENLSFFTEKLSKLPGHPNNISWFDLCRENLPGRKFTFWDWFYEASKLIEQHLKHAWKHGHIKGFIGKEVSEAILCQGRCLSGTFLLRFSDTVLGGMSIVWLHSDGKAYSQSPFRSKDLANQPLAVKLNQEFLLHVYPNEKKELAFEKYYDDFKSSLKRNDSEQTSRPNYVKLRTQLIIDNPDIPRFCLKDNSRTCTSKSDNYAKIHPVSYTPPSNEEPLDESFKNVIEIDIDKIIGDLSSPSYYTDSSMTSPSYLSRPSSSFQMSPVSSICGAVGDDETLQNGWGEAGDAVSGSGGESLSFPMSTLVEDRFYLEL